MTSTRGEVLRAPHDHIVRGNQGLRQPHCWQHNQPPLWSDSKKYPISLESNPARGNPPMNPIPQWSGEVLESNQVFLNYPAIPSFDTARPPQGPHANGMMGSVNQLYQITQQMGQMSS